MPLFNEMGLDEKILDAVKDLEFENPMPIQEKVIPHLMRESFSDLIALAQTGTGKTAAFGLPIIHKTDPSLNKVQFLILSPTRELCLQISDDLSSFARYKPEVKIAAVFGGTSIDRQIQKIQKGVHVVSATPGRLVDLINRRIIDLSNVKIVVLDEADEMLDMGFRDDLETILAETPEKKNTLLFSATMPKEVQRIANKYMNNPFEITIGKKNAGAENVEHLCYLVHGKDRYLALKRIVDFNPEVYGIIFCRTRKETQEVADQLIKDGYNADALHGDLSQPQRDAVMNKFRIKYLQLLVATDVAARGLDVENLTHIINYNLPEDLEIYTHRSGRTGRAGRKGTSVVIVSMKEKNKIYQIENHLNKKFAFAEIPTGKDICNKQLLHLVDRVEKVEVDYSQIDPLLPDIFRKLEWLDREELVKKFVSVEFNRFLDYYKKTSDLKAPQDSGTSGKNKSAAAGFTRFFINLGRMDNLTPTVLMGIINKFTGIGNIEIGEIEILKNFSFFEVDTEYANTVIDAFKEKEFKRRKIVLETAESEKRGGRRGEKRKPGGGNRYREKSGGRKFDGERKRFGSEKRGDKNGWKRKNKSGSNDRRKRNDDKPKEKRPRNKYRSK